MVLAFLRLITIALGSIVGVAVVILGLRALGEKQVYTVPPHPLLNIQPFFVAWGGDSSHGAKPFSLDAYKQAANKHFVLGVLAHPSSDGVWFVAKSNKLSKLHLGHGFLTLTSSQKLSGVLRFVDLVKALPQANYYVKVENPASPYLGEFFKTIESAHVEKHFVLTSPFYDTTKLLRNQNPNWLVGATTSQVAKAQLMSSIYLEPTMSLEAEEFTLPIEPLDVRLLRELTKRKMLVLVRRKAPTTYETYARDVKKLLNKHVITGAIYDSDHLP